jgi:hypothetical protein
MDVNKMIDAFKDEAPPAAAGKVGGAAADAPTDQNQ